MKLSNHDLQQIDDGKLDKLAPKQVLLLAKKFLHDLKEARDRLNQNSNNSSRPPGSMPPWVSTDSKDKNSESNEDNNLDPNEKDVEPKKTVSPDDDYVEAEGKTTERPGLADGSKPAIGEGSNEGKNPSKEKTPPVKRSPGKQEGAQGYGRTQVLPITATVDHLPLQCSACDIDLDPENKRAWSAWFTLELETRSENYPGFNISNTKHVYHEISCSCGHITRENPYKAEADKEWPKTQIGEQRLLGPSLTAMIVILSKRHRQSRRLISEFFSRFCRLELSTGLIDQMIREAGRCVAPLEPELMRDIQKAALVYVDESSWKIKACLYWLWVFKTCDTVLFAVGKRNRDIIANLLFSGAFKGRIMSDGWCVYREWLERLRCWAHLIRKAQGLSESCNLQVADVGLKILEFFQSFEEAIYTARALAPPYHSLEEKLQTEILALKELCTTNSSHEHAKLGAFARELLSDWDVIILPIQDPSLPLTNNEAEQALRHWVIDRRLSHGTRTHEGTRAFSLLASVIETCRLRKDCAWNFLTKVISAARQNFQLPSLPIAPMPALA